MAKKVQIDVDTLKFLRARLGSAPLPHDPGERNDVYRHLKTTDAALAAPAAGGTGYPAEIWAFNPSDALAESIKRATEYAAKTGRGSNLYRIA